MADGDRWDSNSSLADAEGLVRDAETLPTLSPLLRRRILKAAITAGSRRSRRNTRYAAVLVFCIGTSALILGAYIRSNEMAPQLAAPAAPTPLYDAESPYAEAPNSSVHSAEGEYIEAAVIHSPLRRLQRLRNQSGTGGTP